MIICVTANMDSGISAATSRETRFATATPGAASQTYFITGGMFFSARRRSAHLGLGISSAGFASLPAGGPTKARVLTTGSPFSSVAVSPLIHVYRRNSLSESARPLPRRFPRNLLISKDLQIWPNSCSAFFFRGHGKFYSKSQPRKHIAFVTLQTIQESLDAPNRFIPIKEYLKNLICATLCKSVWLRCGHPRHHRTPRNNWLELDEGPEFRARLQNQS